MSGQAVQQIASKLLAQALTEVFPGTLLIKGAFSNVLFHYEAVLPQKIDKTMLCLLEEKMRGFIKAKPAIGVMEMMRQNAANYFNHHEQPIIAENIDALDDIIIPIISIGEFKDLCDPDQIPPSWEAFVFELLDIEYEQVNGERVAQITGSAHLNKEELKTFVKKYRAAKKLDLQKKGRELELFTQLTPTQLVWLPRGEQLKNIFKTLKLNSTIVDVPINIDPEILAVNPKQLFDPTAAWHLWLYKKSPQHSKRLTSFVQKTDNGSQIRGMIRNELYTTDLTHIFCLEAEVAKELIYYLQLLDKIFKIFRFEVQWILRTQRPISTVNAADWDRGVKALTSVIETLGLKAEIVKAPGSHTGPKLQALIHDAIGQQWNGPYIGIDCCHPKLMTSFSKGATHQQTPHMIALAAWGSFERTTALLIEHHQGLLQWPQLLEEVQRKMNSINEESVSSVES